MAGKYHVLVCKGPECGQVSKPLLSEFQRLVQRGLPGGVECQVSEYSCFGKCKRGPNVLVREVRPGENVRLAMLMPAAAPGASLYHRVQVADVVRILDEHVKQGRPIVEFMRRE